MQYSIEKCEVRLSKISNGKMKTKCSGSDFSKKDLLSQFDAEWNSVCSET